MFISIYRNLDGTQNSIAFDKAARKKLDQNKTENKAIVPLKKPIPSITFSNSFDFGLVLLSSYCRIDGDQNGGLTVKRCTP